MVLLIKTHFINILSTMQGDESKFSEIGNEKVKIVEIEKT